MAAHRSRRVRDDRETILKSISAPALPAGPILRAMPASLASLSELGYSANEISELVVPRRTLARRHAHNEPLSVEETDKAMRLQRIASLAARVFGNPDKANRWLRKPKDRLHGKTPVEFLGSESGARVVEEMLVQIDYGMPA